MTATLEEGDDPQACAKTLQQQAETLVEEHKQTMLKSLHELETLKRSQQELQELGRLMKQQQSRIDDLRREHPELNLLPANSSRDDDDDQG